MLLHGGFCNRRAHEVWTFEFYPIQISYRRRKYDKLINEIDKLAWGYVNSTFLKLFKSLFRIEIIIGSLVEIE